MRFSDVRISKKIAASFAAILLGVTTMGGLVYNKITYIEDVRVYNRQVNLGWRDAMDARAAFTRVENSLRGYLLSLDPTYIDKIKKHRATFDQQIAKVQAISAKSPDAQQLVDKALSGAATWQREVADKAIAMAADSFTLDAARLVPLSEAASALVDPTEEAIDGLVALQKTQAEINANEQQGAYTSSLATLGIGIGLLVLISTAIGVLLSRGIARPINGLRDVMERLAKGDKAVEISSIDRKDEVGEMASAVLSFKRAAIEQERLEAEATAATQAQAAHRDRQTAIDNSKAEDLKVFVHAVEDGFNGLAVGDLTVRINQAVAPEFEPIRAKFNESIEKLEDTIGSVVNAIGAIRVGLTQITVASADLSQRTEQQAASLEETVAALAEVTKGVNDTAGEAGHAQVAAVSATKNAEKGGAIVAQAVAAMSQIEESSDKIGKIIGVIDEIAFQTNLLALNAGVEAARAGEAGRGFAVVAQEVRGLAQRSAEAAKEIKDLISTSSAQVGLGVELVTNSGKSLQEIVEQVSNMSGIVSGIAASAKEQSLSLREVSMAADNMDKVTQQNAAMVEETTAAAQSLTTETEALARMVEQFRTKTGTEAARSSRPAVKSRSSTSTPRAVAQMRTTGSGGAAAKPARAPSAESWEEF